MQDSGIPGDDRPGGTEGEAPNDVGPWRSARLDLERALREPDRSLVGCLEKHVVEGSLRAIEHPRMLARDPNCVEIALEIEVPASREVDPVVDVRTDVPPGIEIGETRLHNQFHLNTCPRGKSTRGGEVWVGTRMPFV